MDRQGNAVIIRIGIPECFSVKGKVQTPIKPPTTTVFTGLTYQQRMSLFDTSSRGMDRNEPMLISVANLINQERMLSHAQGGKSRPFRFEEY
jgi:hypothetical protein